MEVEFLIDMGLYRTLLTEEHWNQLQPEVRDRMSKLRESKVKLVPYGTIGVLKLLGRFRCQLKARAGAQIITTVYVIRGAKESLLGLRDGEVLGIMKIQPEGEMVRWLQMTVKEAKPLPGTPVSGGETQGQIDQRMSKIKGQFPKVFMGLGRATGVPDIHIEMDDTIEPVQQKQRQIPIHFKEKLREHLEELIKEGVVTPLECQNGTGWIYNVVITAKKWSPDEIRMNLDMRPMAKAIPFPYTHTAGPKT